MSRKSASKPIYHYDLEQRSDDWYQLRLGKLTASRMAEAIAPGRAKGTWGAPRARYMAELAIERLTGKSYGSFTGSHATRQGEDREPDAVASYEFITGNTVTPCGFVEHHKVKGFGCSPDGLVDDDGCIEIKCTEPYAHLRTIVDDTIDKKYVAQMMGQLVCCERQWCDFISYCPDLPGNLAMYRKRVTLPKEELEMALRANIALFCRDLDAMVAKLEKHDVQ